MTVGATGVWISASSATVSRWSPELTVSTPPCPPDTVRRDDSPPRIIWPARASRRAHADVLRPRSPGPPADARRGPPASSTGCTTSTRRPPSPLPTPGRHAGPLRPKGISPRSTRSSVSASEPRDARRVTKWIVQVPGAVSMIWSCSARPRPGTRDEAAAPAHAQPDSIRSVQRRWDHQGPVVTCPATQRPTSAGANVHAVAAP